MLTVEQGQFQVSAFQLHFIGIWQVETIVVLPFFAGLTNWSLAPRMSTHFLRAS